MLELAHLQVEHSAALDLRRGRRVRAEQGLAEAYSDETARVIDEEIRKIVDEAYDECTRLIDTHWDQLVAVAEALLKYETLSSDDVDRLMKGERIEKPTVAELLSAEAAKTTLPPATAKPTEEPGDDLPDIMPSPA